MINPQPSTNTKSRIFSGSEIVIGGIIINFIVRMTERSMTARQVDPTLIKYADSTIRVLLRIVLVIAILSVFGIETKEPDEWDVKAEATTDRWTAILDRSLERLFERQQRVVTEKALGAKARKALAAGTLSAATVFDLDVWNKQMDEDIRPVIAGIVTEAANLAAEQTGEPVDLNDPAVQQYLDDQVARVQKANETTRAEIATAIQTAQAFSGGTEEDRHLLLKAAVVATFLHLLNSRRRTIAEHEAQTAYNAGTYISGEQAYGRTGGDGSNVTFTKTWVSMHDSRVRTAHRGLDGKSVRFDEGFTVGNQVLRFPGDPLAPPELTINCRCRLRWSKS